MKLPKISITKQKLDINLKFYFFLKYLVKAKLKPGQITNIMKSYSLLLSANNLDSFKQSVLASLLGKTKTAKNQYDIIAEIFTEVANLTDAEVLVFALKLYLIKDLLLHEAKIKQITQLERLADLDPLSLEYDRITVLNPYTVRVNGALLALAFFEGLQAGFSQETDEFIKQLAEQAKRLLAKGIEPNQIFMLLFNESLNQSIISNSGSDYEDRIKAVLLKSGIDDNAIAKRHDDVDSSTEFDLFFTLDGKTYGISAKRTLRERYKQFIKTAQMTPIDVMIEITLGTDLTEEKAKAIINHGVVIFVADEIYQHHQYLQDFDGVYSVKSLNLPLLKNLANQRA